MKCWLLVALLVSSVVVRAAPPVTQHVDPFIGTDGTGHVFPGASVPFGMVAPSPDNADKGWSYSSGYQYRAPKIMGFSNTHISGAGIPELGDVLLMPTSGTPWKATTQDFSSRYAKSSERARPGYYDVRLSDHGVRVELSASQRVAVQRYTFDKPGLAQLLVDFQHGLRFTTEPRVTHSEVTVDAEGGEISGTVHAKNWVERETSFALRFDRPIEAMEQLPPRPGERAPRYLLTFFLGQTQMVVARIAFSTVDVQGAKRNLAAAGNKPFFEVRREADAAWQHMLGRIQIDADERSKRIFYSALYRTLLHPSDIADVDGRVRGPRGHVMQARGGRYYSTLSLWDTFRAVHPLLTLLAPERVDGFVLTMLEHFKQQGYLPLWTAWGRETWTMIGNPALPVMADAVLKGFKGFDANEVLDAMVQTSTAPRPDAPPWAQRDWAQLDRYGYLPFDEVRDESVSKTLEYGIGDDAVARVASALGRRDIAVPFAARSRGYVHLFDPETRVMRGKDAAGNFRQPFDPLAATSPMNNPGDYTEANAWQYTATPMLHDPQGFVAMLGGAQALQDWLARFLSIEATHADKHLGQEAMIGQLAHGNEPSHHIPWLYAWTDAPWLGHALVRRIARQFYSDRPSGIVGNDDCGQMSAWYVLATLGFYPVVPASGEYVLGAPLVRAATLQLAGGKTLSIKAQGFAEDRPYAKQAWLNGKLLTPTALPHAVLAAGGELRFEMQPLPR